MKKIVSLLLFLCMLSSVLQMTVLAAEANFEQEGFVTTAGYSEDKTFNDYFPDLALAKAVAKHLQMSVDQVVSIEQLKTIISLDVSYSGIKDLSGIACLSSLSTLNLHNNQLSSLPAEIGQLSSLQYLYLDRNQLTSLPAEIGQLSNLSDVRVYNNQLSSLPAEIGQLSFLQYLSLDSNQLSSLPAEIGQLSSLSYLNLRNNQLSSLPAEIGQLSSLRNLILSNNQLSSLPAEIGQLSSLRSLDLSNNQLSSLSEEIGQLSSLFTLNLSSNQLSSLPAEIGQLSSLHNLYLDNNQLSSLPAEIGQISGLTNLFLLDNQLSSLPEEIGQLSSLSYLNLRNNQLSSLPAEIGQLSSLRSLDLSHNQLIELPPEIGQLSQLGILYLNNNQIAAIPTEAEQVVLSSLPPYQLACIAKQTNLKLPNILLKKASDITREVLVPDLLQRIIAVNKPDEKRLKEATVTVNDTEYSFYDIWNDSALLSSIFENDGEYNVIIETTGSNLIESGYQDNFDFHQYGFKVIIGEEPQIIGTVTEQHILVDSTGKEIIHSETTHTGNAGDTYSFTAQTISGYALRAVPTNASGTYTQSPITVTFYYDQEAVKPPTGQNFYSYFEDPNFAEIVAATVGKQAADYTDEKELSTIKEVAQAGVEDEEVESLNGVRYLTGLRKLVLNDHLISEIPTEILGLKRLKHLDVRNNQIMEMDEDILGALNLGYGNFLFQGQQADAPRVDYVHGSAATPADLIPDVVLQGIRYDEIYHAKSETEMRKQTIVTVRKISLRNIRQYTLEEFTNGTFDLSELGSGLYTIDIQSPSPTFKELNNEGHYVRFQLKVSGESSKN